MSLKRVMKQKALIERKVTPVTKDKHSFVTFTYEIIGTDRPCFLNSYSPTVGEFKLKSVGEKKNNMYLGTFNPDENIEIGDKVTVSGYPILYVESFIPAVRARSGKAHHKEAVLKISEN